MTKKEKTALLRFAQRVAKANGRSFEMSKMTLLECSRDNEGNADYVMFEYSDGTQWQAYPTKLSECIPLVLDDTQKMKADVVPPKTSLVPQDHNLNSMNAATAYIREQIDIVAQSFCKIGFKLWEVKENQWYKSLGFTGVGEYGEKVLGFKKSSVSNYISICERFSILVDGKPTAELREDFSAFSYTQLSEMLTLPDDKISAVTPDMTCKEVRAMKKKADQDRKRDDEEEQEVFEGDQPYNLFCRTLTQSNFETVVNLLKDVIGKEIQIVVG